MSDYKSKFSIREVVKYKGNKVPTYFTIIGVHFGIDNVITVQCRVETGAAIYFDESELEPLNDDELARLI